MTEPKRIWHGSAMFGRLKLVGKKTLPPEPQALAGPNIAQLEAENGRLKAEVRRYSNIINTSLNPIWQRDRDLKIVYCNLAFSEVAEATTETVVALGELELFKGHRVLAQKALETGEEQIERRHIIVGGERRYYMIREVPVGADGVIGYATHITELEKAQSEIDQHVQALKDLLESSTSAMAIYGRDMRLKFFNFAFVALWKHDDYWLSSEPTYGEVLEVMREKRKLPEQANFKAFKESQLKLFTALIEPQEEFFFLPDGKTLRVVAIPHALGGILFIYEDVTDRLALERSYNTLIAVQRETLDHLHEGVAVFGENGRLHLCNPTFRALWNLENDFTASEPHIRDVLARCRDYFVTDDMPHFLQQLQSRLQSRQLTSLHFERSDGSLLNCSCVPLPDGATLLSFIDVTDSTLVERSLRDRAEALETADRMKTDFLANMSYELRSPLTSISGFAEMLGREYAGVLNSSQREYVEGIYQSSQYLSALIADIIDLATIEAGYLKLNISAFPIRAAVDSVITLLSARLKLHRATIQVTIAADVTQMVADEVRVKQILINLLSNAAKLSKSRGTIDLSITRTPENAIAVTVHDDGPTLDEARLVQLFEPFARGPKSGTESMLSLGLVKRFMQLHGGTVVATAAPERGTIITCLFPSIEVETHAADKYEAHK